MPNERKKEILTQCWENYRELNVRNISEDICCLLDGEELLQMEVEDPIRPDVGAEVCLFISILHWRLSFKGGLELLEMNYQ